MVRQRWARWFKLAFVISGLFWGWATPGPWEGISPLWGMVAKVRVIDGYAKELSKHEIQLVLIMDAPLRPKVFTLRSPSRLVMDLQPVEPATLSSLTRWRHRILRGPIRVGMEHKTDRLRIVLDLIEGASYEVQQDLYLSGGGLGEGARFVLDVRMVPSAGKP